MKSLLILIFATIISVLMWGLIALFIIFILTSCRAEDTLTYKIEFLATAQEEREIHKAFTDWGEQLGVSIYVESKPKVKVIQLPMTHLGNTGLHSQIELGKRSLCKATLMLRDTLEIKKFPGVMLHEIGHTLRLHHDPGTIMDAEYNNLPERIDGDSIKKAKDNITGGWLSGSLPCLNF